MSDEKKPRIKLHFECDESSLAVHTFSVRERMSAPFEVKVSARSHNPDIHLDEIVGKVAGLGVRTETDAIAWTGVCSFMEQVQGEVSDVGLSTYHLTIVPRLWLLTQRRNHRIFQHLTIPEIVKKIFEKYEIEADWTLDDDHPKREYTVQYGETDFAFVSRLFELAGISYSFDRQGGGETGRSRATRKVQSHLVCSDNPQKRPSIGAVYFYDEPNVARQKKFVTNLRVAHEVRSGKVTLRDYDFRRPRLTLEDESKFPLSADEKVEEAYERYHFVHGGSLVEVASAPDKLPVADDRSLARHDKKENLARAERWAEAERWEKRYVELDASEPNLAPGVVFSVKDHPHPEVAEDKTLMVIESMVHGNALDWSLAAKSVFADTKQRYRPALVTPKPRVRGAQTAIVVGPAGKQIHVDEHARVRVKMHWDRDGDFNDEATCWLRVSHAWAGAGFGSVLHPRVGQEVIVDFFQGDPDQPLVTGRLHNMTTVVPRVLPKNKPQSVWRSATSPQTEEPHFNEIMIDDTGQKELMFVQAERDLSKLVRKNETERTFKDRTVIVGAARVSGVAELDTVQVGKRHLAKIVNVKDLHIPEMGEPDTSPTTTWVDMVDDRITITTGKATVELNGANIAVDAAGALRLTSDSMMIIKGGPDVYLNCSPATKVKPKVDKKVSDPVDKPDREIVAVADLTNPKQDEPALGVAHEEGVELPGAKPKPAPTHRFEADGTITDEYYEWLRKRTPNDDLRKKVNQGTKPLKDPVYGTDEDPLEADHIVPMFAIVSMPGFENLTPDQHIEVLNLEANFWGLGRSANGSKGGKTVDEWIAAGGLGGAGLSDDQKKLLRSKDKAAQKAIKKAIADRQP